MLEFKKTFYPYNVKIEKNKDNFPYDLIFNENYKDFKFKYKPLYLLDKSASNLTIKKLNNNLPINELPYVNGTDFNLLIEEFLYLRKSTFISFFITNLIDVPVCFKKSKSLKLKNFELLALKFSNYLMKKGKREKITKIIFQSLRLFFKNLKTEKITVNYGLYSWIDLYKLMYNTFFYEEKYKNFVELDLNQEMLYGHFFLNHEKLINKTFFLKKYLISKLSQISPIFSYFIYSVDKNIRKYSRGKSGKYTFIWKYIPPYKRIFTSVKWIVKDIKFHQSRKITERLEKTFLNLTLNPDKTFAWKSKIFSHNYVFKNFRKSLMVSLKTTS